MSEVAAQASRPLTAFLVAGEESGDALGAGLMCAMRERSPQGIRFEGVGGEAMQAEGLRSRFALAEIATMGLVDVARRLPRLLACIRETASAAVAARPDVLVIIDSPDFTHRVARRVRRAAPQIPIVNYVSPSVWAWRPWRARAMRRYIDHVLALLPFEPAAHEKLGGPPCSYVGHPLAAKAARLRPDESERQRRRADPPVLLVLPGSRRSEVGRLLAPFAATVERVRAEVGPLELVLPTVPHLVEAIAAATRGWPLAPRIVLDQADKQAAFRVARAALAASGTVTLELAIAGVPTVAAYRVTAFEAAVARRLIRVPSVILANLVLGENCIPELLQEDCTPERLAAALIPLLGDTPERQRQVDAFARLDEVMQIGATDPAARAAEIVLDLARLRFSRAAPA
jgi:lipid-A-disaccharide synthase